MSTGASTQMHEEQLIEIKVGLATIETKLDGVVDRLDKINGSVGRHEETLTTLTAEKNLLAKLIKPALVLAAVVVAGLLGHTVDVTKILEFLK
jgi:hypothetical protein